MSKFPVNPENAEALDRAMALVEQHDEGDLISHRVLARTFGVGPQSPLYYQLADRLKRRVFREGRYRLKAVTGVGYVILDPKGKLDLIVERNRQISWRAGENINTAKSIDVSGFSFAQLRAKETAEEQAIQLKRTARGNAQRLSAILKPREQRPRVAREAECAEPAMAV